MSWDLAASALRVAMLLFAISGCRATSDSADAFLPDGGSADLAPADLASSPHGGYVAVVGGSAEEEFGTPHSWSEAAYGFIVEHAHRGRIAVIAATPQDGRLPSYFQKLGAASAESILLDSRSSADDPNLASRIGSADAVFFQDGQPSQYVTLWAGSRAMQAVSALYLRGGVVAGSGAGAQLLGHVVFDERAGALLPEEALRDGLPGKLTFSEDVIPFTEPGPAADPTESGLLPRLLVDTHFTALGRLPRLAVMLAVRAQLQPTQRLLGLGVDEKTALLVDPNLIGTVSGQGSVTLLRLDPASQWRLLAGRPPLLTDLRCDLLTEGFAVDLRSAELRRLPPSVQKLPAAPAVGLGKSVRIAGSSDSDAQAGALFVNNGTVDTSALRHGTLTLSPGRLELPMSLVVTAPFASAALVENRVGGLLWGLASSDNVAGRVGLLLPAGAAIRATDGLTLDFLGEGAPTPDSAALLVDSRTSSYRDRSTYVVEPAVSMRPRQSVALVGLRLHLLSSGARLDLIGGQLTLPPP